MKRKIIISSAVIVSLVLGGVTMSILFPNNRKHYRIYEGNGKYYYRNNVDTLVGSINERIWIAFEDDLALIREYKVSWGRAYTVTIWKYIDKKGKVVLQPNVYLADAFSEGLAAVMPSEGSLWGYINKNGEMIVEPRFRRASMFQNGVASVYIEETGKWILIDREGVHIRDLDEPINWRSYTQADLQNGASTSK